ncbi:MAG: hypothetical protein ACFE9D_10750 [Promethearchaeota archaeon]
MTTRRRGVSFPLITLALSLVGLGLLPLLVLTAPPSIIVPWQNQLMGISFALICILGIIAGVSPSHCSRRSKTSELRVAETMRLEATESSTTLIHKEGHHPTCDQYHGHILRIYNRVLCAGCTGLVTGAAFALIGTILFFFANFPIILPNVIFWIGFILVALGLIQHFVYRLVRVQRGEVRIIVNGLFVIGAFLLLASVVQLTNNLVVSGYLLILTLYWVFTRIAMSRWSHQRICVRCQVADCPLSDAC